MKYSDIAFPILIIQIICIFFQTMYPNINITFNVFGCIVWVGMWLVVGMNIGMNLVTKNV